MGGKVFGVKLNCHLSEGKRKAECIYMNVSLENVSAREL